jgi:DNA polymerase I-like protein with 3'-5' exonuclease and polymerase domains
MQLRNLVPVYDIISCGPRHRYVANGKLVHNCDGINLQNLPARGAQANKLKKCIEAPPGYVIIDCDSSNIEARMLAWLAGQDDLVEDFANGVDVYCKMSGKIFGREVTKADKKERFVGKTTILGAGYGTGAVRLQVMFKASEMNLDLELDECKRIIDTYRYSVPAITRLWRQGEAAIEAMHKDKSMWFGREGVALVEGRRGIKLPSGLYISYPQLHRGVKNKNGMAIEAWQYKDETGLVDIFGPKLVENVVQALARIVVMQQLLKISKKLQVVLTVHDAVAAIAREEEAEQAQAYVEECMRWVPKWAQGCPINCESGIGRSYGDC